MERQIILIFVVIFMHLLLFWGWGSLWMRYAANQKTLSSPVDALVTGYLVYFFLFEVLCIPAELWNIKVSTLGYVVCVLSGIALVMSLVQQHRLRGKTQEVKTVPSSSLWQRHGWMLILVMAVVAFQMVIVALYTDGSADSAYYVAQSAVSALRNRLGRYDVDTGRKLSSFFLRYVFSTYPMHNALVARLSGLAAIIQARTVMPVVNVVIVNLIQYCLGRALFADKDERYADGFVCLMFVLNLYANTLFLPGTFLFTRLYEGKSLVANLVLPLVLCSAVRLWQDESDRLAWGWLFLSGGAAMCFAGTGLLASALAVTCLIVLLLHHRTKKILIKGLVCLLPYILWCALYGAAAIGILSLKIS